LIQIVGLFFWKNNRFDHNFIGDKLNGGCTVIVELNDEKSQNNLHSIDSNFFAGRSPLGSNGGETIRVGVSRYSMTSSQTIIKDNIFYRNSGEVEIISIKSCNNQILNNTFFECEGSIVLRHGQSSTVANNIFIGNFKPYTGGIRIIDSGHIVKNNLFVGLNGNRFRSSITVMNAVPNSLPSRYLHVKDAIIERNLFINCSNFLFGGGKDVERTLAPSNVLFSNNTMLSFKQFMFEDDNNDGGIQFKNNTTNQPISLVKGFNTVQSIMAVAVYKTAPQLKGLEVMVNKQYKQYINTSALHWLQFPSEVFKENIQPVQNVQFTPDSIVALNNFLNDAKGLVNIQLSAGRYAIAKPLLIKTNITITAKGLVEFVNGTDKSLSSFIVIGEGGHLTINGINFNANFLDAGDVQGAIVTPKEGLLTHYTLNVTQCTFKDYNESGYSPIRGNKNSFASTINIANSTFSGNAGTCIDYSTEKDDKGIYNVENLNIDNCIFKNNLNSAINVYRGGNDESTTYSSVTITNCVFDNVDNRQQSFVVRLLGAQYARVFNCNFINSGAGGRSIWFEEYSWDDIQVDFCNFYNSGRVQTFHNKLLGKNLYKLKTNFLKDYQLPTTSPLYKKGFGKQNIGLK
jgi:poly(beta-D-mannuronate) lyase